MDVRTRDIHKQPRADLEEIDEEAPLLGDDVGAGTVGYAAINDIEGNDAAAVVPKKAESVMGIISILFIGCFISNADGSLVLASYSKIASEFQNLESGVWLSTSYMLAMCVAQPLCGKMSDIFGRKTCLQAAYALFAIGTLISGLGHSMTHIIIGRTIQGAGGAGMVCMVSILLYDLVPLYELAAYRSYVNIVQTVGRSCGGAIGGLLTDTIGWRWAFLGQVPITIIAIILVQWKLDIKQKNLPAQQDVWAKIQRVDFIGALFMSLSILATVIVLDLGGTKFAFNSPVIIGCMITAGVSYGTFAIVEKYWAKEPVFPLHLLGSFVVLTSYAMIALLSMAQSALMFTVPIYFQVTQNASTAVAGLHLVPAVFGNTLGGLSSGYWIRNYKTYKIPTVFSTLSSILAFTLLLTLWRGSNDSAWSSLVIFGGGYATGMAHSSVFIMLTSGIQPDEMPIASSGFYLSGNIGMVSGVSGASAIFQLTLRKALERALAATPGAAKIIDRSLSDINYVKALTGHVRELVVSAYVLANRHVFVLGLVSACTALVISVFTKEKRLTG